MGRPAWVAGVLYTDLLGGKRPAAHPRSLLGLAHDRGFKSKQLFYFLDLNYF
jgi:hypothetical protein